MWPRFSLNDCSNLGVPNRVNQGQIATGKSAAGEFPNLSNVIFGNFIGAFASGVVLFMGQVGQHEMFLLLVMVVMLVLTILVVLGQFAINNVFDVSQNRFCDTCDTCDPYSTTFVPRVPYNLSYSFARLYLCQYRKGWELGVTGVTLSHVKFYTFTNAMRERERLQP